MLTELKFKYPHVVSMALECGEWPSIHQETTRAKENPIQSDGSGQQFNLIDLEK